MFRFSLVPQHTMRCILQQSALCTIAVRLSSVQAGAPSVGYDDLYHLYYTYSHPNKAKNRSPKEMFGRVSHVFIILDCSLCDIFISKILN